jgi:hypothetical protein
MQLRRTPRSLAASATAVLALAVPLSSCGFDYATDREYTVTASTSNRDGVVDVLGAVVVSAEPGSGTFIASLSNNDTEEPQTLTGVSGEGITAADFEPVEIAPGGLVNLADPPVGIVLTGDFEAGDFVELTFDFESGQRTTFELPVVLDDFGYWEGLDVS